MKKMNTKDVIIIGMLAAVNIIAVNIKIPYGNGAMVHMGTAVLFATAIAFGGFRAGMASAIGLFLYDVMGPFIAFAPFTLVIKGSTGLIVGKIAYVKNPTLARNIIACLIGAIVTLAGYMVAWSLLLGGIEVAITNIPSSVISSGVGMIVGIPLGMTLKKVIKI